MKYAFSVYIDSKNYRRPAFKKLGKWVALRAANMIDVSLYAPKVYNTRDQTPGSWQLFAIWQRAAEA